MSRAPDRDRYRVVVGEGAFEVRYTDRAVYVIDSQLGTDIMIFYNRANRRWYMYLTSQDGSFLKHLRYISLCVTAVVEYSERRWTTGNLYIDALYCEKIDESELQDIQPSPGALALYEAGYRRPYRRWLGDAVERVARRIALAIRERLERAEDELIRAIDIMFGDVPIDYVGYMVTGYQFCAGLLYGIFCRIAPDTGEITRCRPLCEIAPPVLDYMCSDELEDECISTQPIYRPMKRLAYGS